MPVITAAQLLDWTDGRNGSQFANVGYGRGLLSFQSPGRPARRGLEAMLPASAANGALNSLTRNGQDITGELRTRTVKGITYYVFAGAAGAYVATYGVPAHDAAARGRPDSRHRRHGRHQDTGHRRQTPAAGGAGGAGAGGGGGAAAARRRGRPASARAPCACRAPAR